MAAAQQSRSPDGLGGVLQGLNDAVGCIVERHAIGRARGAAVQREAASRLQSGAKRLVDTRLARATQPARTPSGIGYASIFSWLNRDKGDAQGKGTAIQGKPGRDKAAQRQGATPDECAPPHWRCCMYL